MANGAVVPQAVALRVWWRALCTASPTSVLQLFEEILAHAGRATRSKCSVADVERRLRARGQVARPRRVEQLVRARQVCAHPNVQLAADVFDALSEVEGGTDIEDMRSKEFMQASENDTHGFDIGNSAVQCEEDGLGAQDGFEGGMIVIEGGARDELPKVLEVVTGCAARGTAGTRKRPSRAACVSTRASRRSGCGRRWQWCAPSALHFFAPATGAQVRAGAQCLEDARDEVLAELDNFVGAHGVAARDDEVEEDIRLSAARSMRGTAWRGATRAASAALRAAGCF